MFVLDATVRTVPKAGHSSDQNEDAWALNAGQGLIAIADGASEGWQSGPWAITLTQGYVLAPPQPADFSDWLTRIRTLGPALPAAGSSWYAETKALQGAFSTLLGVSFELPRNGTGIKWRAMAVGDCCLFHLRAGKILTTFPIETISEFDNRPALVGSASHVPHPSPDWYAGRAELGDQFLLLTDALAEWLMKRVVSGQSSRFSPEDVLQASTAQFASWLQHERRQKAIRNDDTTIIRVILQPQSSE